MFSFFKRVAKKMIYSFRCDEKAYIDFLRKGGAEIGERVRIFDPPNTVIDATRPFMIKIGNDVQITSGVTILTHGYDWSVLKELYRCYVLRMKKIPPKEVFGEFFGCLKKGRKSLIGLKKSRCVI